MLDHARSRDGALFRDVADQEDCNLALLGEPDNTADAFAQLRHGTGRRRDIRCRHRLDRIDDQRLRPHRHRLLEHVVDRRIGQQAHCWIVQAQAMRALRDLAQRLFPGRVADIQVAGQFRRNLLQQGRLADPGIAAQQHDRAGHQPAAEHTVEFPETGGKSQPGIVGQLAERGRLNPCLPRARCRGRYRGLGEGVPRIAVRTLALPLDGIGATFGANISFLGLRHAGILFQAGNL